MSRPTSARRPRRVLHVARRFAPMVGGIERYVLDVATAQARRGSRVDVVTLRVDVLGAHVGDLAGREVIDGVVVERLPGVGNQRFGLCLRPDRLARAVRSADVVHVHDLRFMLGFVAIVARLTHRPLVFHTHGLLAHTTFASRLKRWMLRGYYGPMLRVGHALVVASSEHDREMLVADVPALAPRTRTLLNAVDLRRFLAVVPEPRRGRILVIGRVAERKGIDRLLRGLEALQTRPDVPEWSLHIAGTEEASERDRLDGIVRRAGFGDRVRFIGGYRDDEHASLLAGAELVVFPSRAEGFGLALLEAMASGIPVLASDIAPHRALLGADAPEVVIDFDDPSAVADALRTALGRSEEERVRLGDRLRAAAGAYDIERLADELEEAYANLGVPG